MIKKVCPFCWVWFCALIVCTQLPAQTNPPIYGNRGQCDAHLPRVRHAVTVTGQQQNADQSITAQLDCQPFPIHVPKCAIIGESQTVPHTCPCQGCGNAPPLHTATVLSFWDFP